FFFLLSSSFFVKMARSATNVIGNSIAAVMVAKWEGQLAEEGAWDEGEEIEGDLEHGHLDDGDGSIEASIDDGDPRKELLCSREDLE
ncbi:MAG: hypothetical protein Q8P67_17865, partial [archaeon]|nr:hypothetical protein [archaeon]